jgi:hypothetical protein
MRWGASNVEDGSKQGAHVTSAPVMSYMVISMKKQGKVGHIASPSSSVDYVIYQLNIRQPRQHASGGREKACTRRAR